MKSSHLLTLLSTSLLPLTACSVAPSYSAPSVSAVAPAQANSSFPTLSASDKRKIGNKIWQNESGGTVAGLTAWNSGEEFPSLGIGHFIWYPKNYRGPYTESFPAFIRYAQQRGAKGIPTWVLQTPSCPWTSRTSFNAAKNGPQLTSLRNFLASNIELQTDFILAKSQAALGKMLAAAPAAQRPTIQANYAKVATTSNGAYALIDYVNFKGEGINPKERYNGQGWGLLQVLSNMRPVSSGQPAAAEFAASAKRTLDNRIKNSNPARPESQWRAGWHNRCNTYARPL
ncbi:MAG: hypothetical protein ACSHX6_16165 [Akkermansiaceae bacterium]